MTAPHTAAQCSRPESASPPIQPAPVLGRVQDASLRSRRSAVSSASLTRPARRRRSTVGDGTKNRLLQLRTKNSQETRENLAVGGFWRARAGWVAVKLEI